MDRHALVDGLLAKRERFNAQAHRLREQRDHLNDGTKRHSVKRDEHNAQVRAMVEKANAHRSRRDATNQKVREAKARRDELNKTAHAKAEALTALRRERGGGAAEAGAVPLPKLRAEIQQLEYQHQTTVLTPKKEKALIDLIGAKLKELKEREASYQESGEMKTAYEAMKAAKAAAEEAHAAVTVLATEAQAEHDTMIQLFQEADAVRKLADAEQAGFVKHKVEADKVHREFIEAVSNARDLDRVVNALRGTPERPTRDRATGQAQPSAQDRADADDIFEKFRKGEKLSTEDLIALQKGGRL